MKNFWLLFSSFLILACDSNKRVISDDEMVLVGGGDFIFGNELGKENEEPEVSLYIKSFYLDKHEVTNADFQKFVNETSHITSAEQIGSSMIYSTKWEISEGTTWKNEPYGSGNNLDNFNELPVVHVSWNDAKAYCKWKNKRLVTEQEFEYVLEKHPSKDANIWQGEYPTNNSLEDGFFWTAPAVSFSPNKLGIYNLAGNVWEWTADNYHDNVHNILSLKTSDTSAAWTQGCYEPGSLDPNAEIRVLKGGSFLCHDSYCSGYRPEARMSAEPSASYFHVGFRCACDL